MFGQFLGVSEQTVPRGGILNGIGPPGPGPGNWPDCHFAVADPHQYLRTGPDQCKPRHVEEIQEGRRVDPPECAVKIEWRQRKIDSKTLGEHDLKNVAGQDIGLRPVDHIGITRRVDHRGWLDHRERSCIVAANRDGLRQARRRGLDPLNGLPIGCCRSFL